MTGPSQGYHCCEETPQPKQLGEEMVYLACAPKALFIIDGNQERSSKQGRSLETGADTEAMEGCC